VAGGSDVDPNVAQASAGRAWPVSVLQAALAALSCSRFLAGTTEQLLIFWLKQVCIYFPKPELCAEIAAAVGKDDWLRYRGVVAHSLGLVVADEDLCMHPGWNGWGLVALSSSQAIRNIIFDRLTPAPQRLPGSRQAAWPPQRSSRTNIADRTDFVAVVKQVRPVFGNAVADVEIENGARTHRVARYLTAAETGAAIVSGFRDGLVSGHG